MISSASESVGFWLTFLQIFYQSLLSFSCAYDAFNTCSILYGYILWLCTLEQILVCLIQLFFNPLSIKILEKLYKAFLVPTMAIDSVVHTARLERVTSLLYLVFEEKSCGAWIYFVLSNDSFSCYHNLSSVLGNNHMPSFLQFNYVPVHRCAGLCTWCFTVCPYFIFSSFRL